MSCCCSSKAEKRPSRGKLEFSKVCSTGFEKEKKVTYYPENAAEKTSCQKAASLGSLSSRYTQDDDDEDEDDDDIRDMVFVDGNEADLEACDDEDTLMERVWWLTKPPFIPKNTVVVPARRIQVVKERLSSTIKPLPNLRDAFKNQVEKNMRSQSRGKGAQYISISKFANRTKSSCQQDMKTTIPSCARRLSDLF